MPCNCKCRQEQIAAEEQARKEQQRLDRIRRLKANGLQDKALLAYTFDKADNDNPAMKYAHRYVTHWAEVKAEGQGLLFWGGVGTGKTFAAACIANALTEQGIPVLMTNFSKILNSLSGMFSEDRNKYLASFGLTLTGLKEPKDIAHARIYDRILERCAPVRFSGRNYRTENAENTKNAIREIFTEEDSL